MLTFDDDGKKYFRSQNAKENIRAIHLIGQIHI